MAPHPALIHLVNHDRTERAMTSPIFPASLALTGESQSLRRAERATSTDHRVWYIVPRYGTADTDRWALVSVPIPAPDNPAADFEDGQYASLAEAREALASAVAVDDGAHIEE